MTIRATADRKFLLRFLVIGIVCFGFCAYCLYDGLYAYPKHRLEPALAYEALVEEGEEDRWVDLAREKGWNEAKPKKSSKEARADIIWQYVMAVLSVGIGAPVLLLYFRTLGSWVEADEAGIRASWGAQLAWDEISEVDCRRWDKKGIARIAYSRGGASKTFVLDDFKYLREPTDRIMKQLEARVAAEKFVRKTEAAE